MVGTHTPRMSETPKVMESMSEAQSVNISLATIQARFADASPVTYQGLKDMMSDANRQLWHEHHEFGRKTPLPSSPEHVSASMVSMVPALGA